MSITHVPDALEPYVEMNLSRLYELQLSAVSASAALTLSSVGSYRGVAGHLLSIHDAMENAFVKWLVGAQQVWMGLHRAQANGPWVLLAGSGTSSSPNYTHWLYGHPRDGSDSSDCAVFDGSTGRWIDESCDAYSPYVVEYDCGPGYVFGPSSCIGLHDDRDFVLG